MQRLDPDQTAEYVAAHDDVLEALTDAMERGDLRTLEPYIRDDVVVCIERADPGTWLNTVDGDEKVAEWKRYTSQFNCESLGVNAVLEAGIPFMHRT